MKLIKKKNFLRQTRNTFGKERSIGMIKLRNHHLLGKNQLNFFFYCTKIEQDTIFALASGRGGCAVSVVRVSGSKSHQILKNLLREKQTFPKQQKQLYLRYLYEIKSQNEIKEDKEDILDKCKLLNFFFFFNYFFFFFFFF